MDDHYLAVDDDFARNGQRASDLRESLGPIQPVASEDLLPSSVEMNLHAVAVVLDFMEPLCALGRFGPEGGELGLNEPRHLNTLWHFGTHKCPPHLGGQRRSFYLLPAVLEQSGEVSAPATTNGSQIFPIKFWNL
jgi:hypothetical protein